MCVCVCHDLQGEKWREVEEKRAELHKMREASRNEMAGKCGAGGGVRGSVCVCVCVYVSVYVCCAKSPRSRLIM